MVTAKPLVGLLGVGMVVFCVGALVSLVATTLMGPYGTTGGVVVLLLVVAVGFAVAVGARGGAWLDNPGYW